MYGKRIAPVDYAAYVQESPTAAQRYRVRNRTEPYIIWRSTEESPLFSSFTRGGYDPLAGLRWLRGRNDFDRQLASTRHHRFVLMNHKLEDTARHYLLWRTTPDARSRPSVVESIAAFTSSAASDASKRCCSNLEGRAGSAPPLRAGRILSGAATTAPPAPAPAAAAADDDDVVTRPQSAVTFLDSRGSRSGNNTVLCGTRGAPPTPPVLCVHNDCLVVRNSVKAPATSVLVNTAGRTAGGDHSGSRNIFMPHPPPQKSGERKRLSRYYDERMMRLLRGGAVVV
ncbi:hypothetical protein DQ04_03571010 [Trypanosoma grayi]|uniref:hypothetical protein n=1 Tax=Trypanosoma grayi TaxID=71804 RepID=UPI0004F48796|nr:hypothetical protein DQ04_03571010 [Trypanosoma grayi]KEG10558.1 hypothetical protein DQ04_03571010 [Trypanosoma grayi]